MYLARSPFWLRWLYPTLVWHKDRNDRSVYLTFDDGPVPVVTPFVLDTLKKFQVKATFFCIGDNIEKFPEIFSQLRTNGHVIGNHTHNHLKGWKTSTSEYLENIARCQEIVDSGLFRPPYGRISYPQINALRSNYQIIMWDVLSGDFDETIDAEQCIRNVLKNVRNGSIIVFHDSVKAFPRLEKCLPVVLDELNKQGYQFKTL